MKSEAQIREALAILKDSPTPQEERLGIIKMAVTGWLEWVLDQKSELSTGAQNLLDGLKRDKEIVRRMEVN